MSSFLDSNVLLYLLEGDNLKCEAAEKLLAAGGTISVQVLNEFTDVARRKHKFSFEDIAKALAPVKEKCAITPLTVAMQERGHVIAQLTRIRIYDACIIAAAELSGCGVLYTEDLNSGQRIGSVPIRNPFA